MMPDARVENYLRKALRYAKDDSLERAELEFCGLTAEQMAVQHGASGRTRQQVLDGYRAARALYLEAVAYLEGLIEQSRRAA